MENELLWWVLGGGVPALVIGAFALGHFAQRYGRRCPRCKNPRRLLDEKETSLHLDAAQLAQVQAKTHRFQGKYCDVCRRADLVSLELGHEGGLSPSGLD